MNRQQVVLILREIMINYSFFFDAKMISINHNEVKGAWELHVGWMPHPLETECLKKIIAKYGAEIFVLNEQTVFR